MPKAAVGTVGTTWFPSQSGQSLGLVVGKFTPSNMREFLLGLKVPQCGEVQGGRKGYTHYIPKSSPMYLQHALKLCLPVVVKAVVLMGVQRGEAVGM